MFIRAAALFIGVILVTGCQQTARELKAACQLSLSIDTITDGAIHRVTKTSIQDSDFNEMDEAELSSLVAKSENLGIGIGVLSSAKVIREITGGFAFSGGGRPLLEMKYGEVLWDVDDRLIEDIRVNRSANKLSFRFTLRTCPQSASPTVSYGTTNALPSSFFKNFIRVNRGQFQMGDTDSALDARPHWVTLTKDFEMQAYLLTQEEWASVMGSNPSYFRRQKDCPSSYRPSPIEMCPTRPVETVSYVDALEFLSRLNQKTDAAFTYRLPTEAEWEYVARAGTKTPYYFGKDATQLDQNGWYRNNARGQTHDVGQLAANPWGFLDMSGNVWQWVSDWYAPYPDKPAVDPQGPEMGVYRVARGGSWFYPADYLRSSKRIYAPPSMSAFYDIGFRLVRTDSNPQNHPGDYSNR